MRAIFKLFLALAVTLSGVASETSTFTVSATSALRVAWVEQGAQVDEPTPLQRSFGPVFRVALPGIYGARTEVVFVSVRSNEAAELLRRGDVDAVLQFSTHLSRRIKSRGHLVLKAESVRQPGRYVAYLVLPESQASLQDVLANAFSASINDFEVRATLDDALPGVEVAGW